MKKPIKKKAVKGKNKFIRLDEGNLKYVVDRAKKEKRSQNFIINDVISDARIKDFYK